MGNQENVPLLRDGQNVTQYDTSTDSSLGAGVPSDVTVTGGEENPIMQYEEEQAPTRASGAHVSCRVCDATINLDGKQNQHVVKCSQCNEATPIKQAPPGNKYVRCPCNCLMICKATSTQIVCPRSACRCVLDLYKELRSFFKNGGDDPFKKTAPEEARYNSLRLPSSYDLDKTTSSAVAAIPDKIKCESCTQLTAPSNLRMCSDCKKYCLCCICLTNEHWGHNIKMLPTLLQTVVIQDESDKTLEKLTKWTGSVAQGYMQIHVGCGKVVDNYNWLYTKALRETDLALLHTIRERSNIGQLQKSIDGLIGAQIMVRSNVEELAKSLSDIVTEEKAVCAENDVASDAACASTSKCLYKRSSGRTH